MFNILKKQTKAKDSLPIKLVVGLLTAFNYALYPALITLFALSFSTHNIATEQKVAVGFSLVAVKELFTLLALIFFFGPKTVYLKLKEGLLTRSGLIAGIAGLFGGPIGYSFVTISALFVGGALAIVVTSSSTILTLIGERFFIKRKLTWPKISGIAVAGVAVLLMPLFNGMEGQWNMTMLLGYLFAFLGSLSWTIENLLMDVAMKSTQHKTISSSTSLVIKLVTSTLFILVFLLPFIAVVTSNVKLSYSFFDSFFLELHNFWGIVLVGVVLFAARFFFLKSIKLQGSAMASVWNSMPTVFTPIIIIMFSTFGITELAGDAQVLYNWWFWVFSIIMIIGSLVATLDVQILNLKISRRKS